MSTSQLNEALSAFTQLGELQEYLTGDIAENSLTGASDLLLVLEGELERYVFDDDLKTCRVLQRFSQGQLVGVQKNQSASVQDCIRACQPTLVCRLSAELQSQLANGQHWASMHYITLLTHTLASQAQSALLPHSQEELRSPVVDAIVQRAVVAQSSFQHWSEDRVDELIADIADAVNRQAWELAEQAIEETGMGVVAHRVQKILLGTMEIAASLQGQPGSGALAIESPNVDTITVPMGVILGLIPVTNPVETLVFKVLIALKSRNAIVLSCHRKARQVSLRTVNIVRNVLVQHGANADLVQTPELPAKRELTSLLMSHPDISFILATGGTNMVRSAYRSGTPSIGVGKGNAPVWVCADANLELVAQQIVESKAFDNGVVCGSENNLLVDQEIQQPFMDALNKAGAAVLDAQETQRLLQTAFAQGSLSETWLGKSAQAICAAAGIERSSAIELIVVPQAISDINSPLFREKLAPIVSMVTVRGEHQALAATRSILANEGRGHTAIIHTQNQQRVEAFAQAADVCRVLVNSPGTQGCIGACNGLELSWTLGCGTAGGSSTSDNVTYRHLQNTKRIAHGSQAVARSQPQVRKLA